MVVNIIWPNISTKIKVYVQEKSEVPAVFVIDLKSRKSYETYYFNMCWLISAIVRSSLEKITPLVSASLFQFISLFGCIVFLRDIM